MRTRAEEVLTLAHADGSFFGSGAFVWRVFAPPWWRLDRWLHWWLFEKRPHGEVIVTSTNLRGDKKKETRLRVVEARELQLPNVPSPYSDHVHPGVPR